MGRFRVLAAVAAAVTMGGLALPMAVQAAPAAAPHHPTSPTAAPAHSSAAVQWTRGTDGKVSGLVHYSSGLTERIAQRGAAPGKFTAAARAAVRARVEQSRPMLAQADVPAADQGTITGHITDSQHHPLAGVEVEVFGGDSNEPISSTPTSAAGRYAITLPAGDYFVGFDGRNATGGNSDATGYVGTGDEIQIGAGDHVIRSARLQPGAQLRVRVTDRGGHPLAGVSPFLQLVMPYVQDLNSGGISFVDFQTEDLTGPDGTFTFRGLASDAALVCFSTSGDRPTGGAHDALGYADRCARHPIALAPGSSSDFPTVQLSGAPGGALTGVVTSAHGNPIANAQVLAEGRSAHGGSATTENTASDGSYRLTGLAPGSYHVCAFTDDASGSPLLGYAQRCRHRDVEVRRGAVSPADVTLHRGGAITGTITGASGAPVDGAAVFVSGPQTGFGVTEANGQYRVKGLGSGRYRVCIDATNALDPDNPTGDRPGCYQHKTQVAVHAGSVRGHIDVQLRVGGAIAGRITDSTGAGVADVAVDAESVPDFEIGGSAVTDANGDYRITGLPSGSYEVCLFAFDLASGGSQKCHHGVVGVQVGDTTELDESLAPDGPRGSIAVTVRDEQGRPVQGVDVAVLKPCTHNNSFFCESEPLFGHSGHAKLVDSRTVDIDGRAQSDGRKPGSYAVCLFAYYGVTTAGAPPTGYTDRCAGRTFVVTVTAGATRNLHLTLHPGGRVEGRITDPAGHPVPHVTVHVSHSAAVNYLDPFADFPLDEPGRESPLSDATTHQDGTFAIHGVRPGADKVCVQAPPSGDFLDRCKDRPVTVSANGTTHMHDLPLRRTGAIAGVVRNAAGHRLHNVIVLVFTAARRPRLAAVDFDLRHGHFRENGLSPGHYIVCFDAPGYAPQCYRLVTWHPNRRNPNLPADATKVVVKAGQTTRGIDAEVHRHR